MCSRSLLNSLLEKLTAKSKEVFGEKLRYVILYGSYARGDNDEESDIDVMIIADIEPGEIMEYSRRISDYVSGINVENGVFISPMLQDAKGFDKWQNTVPFYNNVANEGVKVYG